MFFLFSTAFSLLSVADAAGMPNAINTTVGESTVLPCRLMISTPLDLQKLRFYWQDGRNFVLYSFNKGEEKPDHVHEYYQDKITAFLQDMIAGNISVKLENPAFEDHQRVFKVYAKVFDDQAAGLNTFEPQLICQITLNVAVPYRNVSLEVNKEATTAVCTARKGFPEAFVKLRVQYLLNNSQHFLDPTDVSTTTEQDLTDRLYSLRTTMQIPKGHYQSMTCFIHNPTSNETLSDTYVLDKGEAVKNLPLPLWALSMMATVVLLVSAA